MFDIMMESGIAQAIPFLGEKRIHNNIASGTLFFPSPSELSSLDRPVIAVKFYGTIYIPRVNTGKNYPQAVEGKPVCLISEGTQRKEVQIDVYDLCFVDLCRWYARQARDEQHEKNKNNKDPWCVRSSNTFCVRLAPCLLEDYLPSD